MNLALWPIFGAHIDNEWAKFKFGFDHAHEFMNDLPRAEVWCHGIQVVVLGEWSPASHTYYSFV
jgi:hypothetical protein